MAAADSQDDRVWQAMIGALRALKDLDWIHPESLASDTRGKRRLIWQALRSGSC